MSNQKENYIQCDMKNETWHIHTAWIPKRFAKVNKKILIDSLPGLWTVMACWESREASYVEELSRDYKHTYASIEER